jgi:hypothetical protein
MLTVEQFRDAVVDADHFNATRLAKPFPSKKPSHFIRDRQPLLQSLQARHPSVELHRKEKLHDGKQSRLNYVFSMHLLMEFAAYLSDDFTKTVLQCFLQEVFRPNQAILAINPSPAQTSQLLLEDEATWKRRVADAEAAKETAVVAYTQVVTEITGLKQHLQTAQSELVHARNEMTALEKTKEAEFQQKVSELEKQKASALEAVNAKVSDAESKLRLLLIRGKSKIDLLNGEKQQLAVKETELQTAVNGLQTQLTAATTTVEALTTEKQQLQAEVQTMSVMKQDYVGMQERLRKAIEDKDEYEAECRRQLTQRLEEVEARAKTCPADVERNYVRRDQLFPFVKEWESDRKQLAETRLKAATLEGDSYHQAYLEWQLKQDNETLALRHAETGKRLLEAAAAHFGTEAETLETAAKKANVCKRRRETEDENADDEDNVDSALKRQRHG